MGQGPDMLQGCQAGRDVGQGWQGWAAAGAELGVEHCRAFDWKQIDGLPVEMSPAASQQDWGGGVPGARPSLLPMSSERQ